MEHTWAVIGYGGMGEWHYKSIKKYLPQIRTKGAYDIRVEANKAASENGLYTYKTLDELLDDPEVDLVTIATPNNFHKDLSIRSLRAGKNVICEKPVTMNAIELEEIMDVVDETSKVFSVHQNRRWDKDYCIIKEVINNGIIGAPYFIESRVQGSRGSMHGWRNHKINGGGMLLDWGVHLVDQMMDMIDSPVVSVCGHLQKVFGSDVDDNIKAFLRFENGVSATCEMVTNCFIALPRWRISGLDGTAVVEDWSCKGRIVQLNTDAELAWDDEIVYTEAGPTRTMAPRPKQTLRELPLPEVKTDWTDYYKNILKVIDGEAELIIKPEQLLRVMKVIDLLFQSEEEGQSLACYI